MSEDPGTDISETRADARRRARARALRAARAVTFSVALVGAPLLGCSMIGCGASHTPDGVDSGGAVTDAGSDSGLDCPAVFPPTTQECCEAEPGGYWDPATGCSVAVPGPFIPPAMV